jgi:predicted acylesterase/phospholipase RssA
VLAEVSIFGGLDPSLREEIAERSEVVHLAGGTHLFRAGDVADALYIVLGGRCEVVDADDQHILTLNRGAVLGELGLITGAPRAASIRARRDTELLKLDHAEFEGLMLEQPAFALGLTRELGSQLQSSRPRVVPNRGGDTSIALVPLGPDVRVEEIADTMAEAIGSWEHLVRLDKPETGVPPVTLSELEHLERHHDRVLFVSGALTGPTAPDAWAEFCLRQADRIVGVVGGGRPPEWLRQHPSLLGCDLVLTGDGGNAQGWLDELRPQATHRIRPGTDAADARRLARRLTGRSVGIVLSGGGARAFAHLGVIQELLEAGVEIDRVGGTSMGAFIGGLVAQELSLEEIDARCYDEWVRRNPLTDYRVPRVSLIRGEKIKRMFLRTLPGSIELLPRDFFCVSADLVSGEQVVHRTGSLAYAVSASMCLPGLAPPVADGPRFLIDGGAINNLPVDEMAARREGPVIAVDVTAREDAPNGNGAKGRRQRADWPWNDDAVMPGIGETITRLVLLGSVDTAMPTWSSPRRTTA